MNDLPQIEQNDFIKRVWKDFSSVDLDGYVKTLKHAGNARYLSWSDAWHLIMDRYPFSVDEYEIITLENKSVEVRCRLTISDGVESFTREMHLPVMDSKNNAVIDPTSRAISDAKARCMVKCASKFGLGLWLYSGDELPKLETAPNILVGNIGLGEFDDLTDRLESTKSDVDAFLKFFKIESLGELPAAKYKNAVALLDVKAKKVAK